jgi:hypothetical protein
VLACHFPVPYTHFGGRAEVDTSPARPNCVEADQMSRHYAAEGYSCTDLTGGSLEVALPYSDRETVAVPDRRARSILEGAHSLDVAFVVEVVLLWAEAALHTAFVARGDLSVSKTAVGTAELNLEGIAGCEGHCNHSRSFANLVRSSPPASTLLGRPAAAPNVDAGGLHTGPVYCRPSY